MENSRNAPLPFGIRECRNALEGGVMAQCHCERCAPSEWERAGLLAARMASSCAVVMHTSNQQQIVAAQRLHLLPIIAGMAVQYISTCRSRGRK